MAHSFRDLLRSTRTRVREVTVDDVRTMTARGDRSPVLIDVREVDEYEQGYIPGAIHIPRGFLEQRIEDKAPDRDAPIVLYCAGGVRSVFAADTLQQMGYGDVSSMAGGFGKWKDAGYRFDLPRVFTPEQRQRYSRHLLIPEVGETGQARLLDSKVLLIGAGGLGSPAAFYLAAAGVGTLGIVDSDVVDRSNLQRQILHTDARVGMSKVESARQAIAALNPDVKVVGYQERLTSENILEVFGDYDVIVDGSDNFPTRYLVNDACVVTGKPNIHAAIFRFDGQATVFMPKVGPCYRCLYPEPPPAEFAPNCDEAGTLGVLPGVVGLIQATEAIKVLLGIGEPLIGRLLHFDALTSEFRTFRVRRDPECPICGDNPTIKEFIDYELFCAAPSHALAAQR
ncbi:MAG: molybdopterin-synthase adenylyltransferase MoeB [Chloroflexi bacterium]|nr:molybdopterin-synthase adenylyltransferase MoeB [Chloroflexota bacterium]